MADLQRIIRRAGRKALPEAEEAGAKRAAGTERQFVEAEIIDEVANSPDAMNTLNANINRARKEGDIEKEEKLSSLKDRLMANKGKIAGGTAAAAGGAAYLSSPGKASESAKGIDSLKQQASSEAQTPKEDSSKQSSKFTSVLSTYAPKSKSIEDIGVTLRKAEEAASAKGEYQSPEINNRLKELKQQLDAAKAAAKEGRRNIDIASTIEKFGQALVMLGAGYQGMKSGVDMSGTKFSATDWSKQYDAIKDDLNAELSGISEERKELSREKERGQERSDKEKDFSKRAIVDEAQQRNRAAESFNRTVEEEKMRGGRQTVEKAEASAIKAAEKDASKSEASREKKLAALEDARAKIGMLKSGDVSSKEKDRLKKEILSSLSKAGGGVEAGEAVAGAGQSKGGFMGFFGTEDYDSILKYTDSLEQQLAGTSEQTKAAPQPKTLLNGMKLTPEQEARRQELLRKAAGR